MNQILKGRCLGLIGGLGVGATVHYYQELAKAHETAGITLQLIIAHADLQRVFRHVQTGEPDQLARYLAELIGQLHAAGARIAAISAVMPHICTGKLLAISPLPLIDLLSSVREEIQVRDFRRLALFGTRFTIETGLFGQLQGVELVTPHPDEVEYIHHTYLQVALDERGAQEHRTGFDQARLYSF